MISPFSESPSQAVGASIRIGLTADDIKQAFRDNLVCGMGRLEAVATKHDLYFALALTVRDRLFHRSVASIENYGGAGTRRVAYLSAEFLLGPHLANNLLNLGITIQPQNLIFPPAINSDKPILIQCEQRRRAGTPLAQVLSDHFAIFELTNSQTK